MAEETTTNEQQEQKQDAPANAFQLERCYMKDASVEMPHAPEVFITPLQKQPTIDMQFEVSLKKLNEPHHEVTVRATMSKWLTSAMSFARRSFIRTFAPILRT